MSKLDSPSPNNSRTSSETSETQSVEENLTATGSESRLPPHISNSLVDRNLKKSKRMKDPNNDREAEKRPPWRAVSISTLPKPDKNALLKAKLLDASRRLRAGKVSVSIQTDNVPTKLVKEVSLDVQVDLILLREIGVMTDGSYMKKKQGTDEFVLTYSISTITDAVKLANISTQTLLPKLPEDDFVHEHTEYDIGAMDQANFNILQQRLSQQIQKVRAVKNINSPENSSHQAMIEENYSPSLPRPQLLKSSTLKSWHFELDEIGMELPSFQPYTISPNRPWKSFMPLSYNMNYVRSQRLDWNILFLAIEELIHESNSLVDTIEDLSRPRTQIAKLTKFEKCIQQLPSDYWLPKIEEQEKKLESMKENAKNSYNE